MTKKQYIILGVTILAIILIITLILINNKNTTWTKEIINSNSYEIYKTDCNNNETKLENSAMTTIDKYWNELSNNGPWIGEDACYEKITIKYDINGIIQEREILIIDNSSVVLTTNNISYYYVNAENLIKVLK